jgi:hypothetical protein
MSEQPNVRTVVASAMVLAGFDHELIVQYADSLSDAVVRELRRFHLAIHDETRCARLPSEDLGRPMTEAEQAAVAQSTGEPTPNSHPGFVERSRREP